MRNGSAHAVCIRIGCDNKVRLDLLREVESQLQCLAELRVRILAGREVAIRLCLLRHDRHVLDANLLEDAGHALHAGAIERRVDDRIGRICLEARNGDLLDSCDVVVEDLLRRPLDEALLEAFLEVHHLDSTKHRGLRNGSRDLVCCLVCNLAAIVVVDLVAIVLGRVVRSGQDDAGRGVEIADSERQRRHRLDARIHIDMDAVGSKDTSSDLLEILALETGVTGERERRVIVVSVEVVRDTLRCLCDDVDVHAVRADTERATKACSAKLEIAVEGIVQLVFVARSDEGLKLLLEIRLGHILAPQIDFSLYFSFHVHPPRYQKEQRRSELTAF